MPLSLTDIQQSFVRHFMTDDRVIGVRMRHRNGDWFLDVEVDEASQSTLDLPETYYGLGVCVRASRPAVLAYGLS